MIFNDMISWKLKMNNAVCKGLKNFQTTGSLSAGDESPDCRGESCIFNALIGRD